MTVYFTASITGKKEYLSNYLAIIKALKAKKYRVIVDHILKADENQISRQTKEERVKFQRKLEHWIASCDFVVAETSFPSISVGYEIFLASLRKKPILLLSSNGQMPSLLKYQPEEKIICKKYKLNEVKKIINDFIDFVRENHDIRFNFFVTPKIATYLTTISRKEKLPKSVFLRKLIEKEMRYCH